MSIELKILILILLFCFSLDDTEVIVKLLMSSAKSNFILQWLVYSVVASTNTGTEVLDTSRYLRKDCGSYTLLLESIIDYHATRNAIKYISSPRGGIGALWRRNYPPYRGTQLIGYRWGIPSSANPHKKSKIQRPSFESSQILPKSIIPSRRKVQASLPASHVDSLTPLKLLRELTCFPPAPFSPRLASLAIQDIKDARIRQKTAEASEAAKRNVCTDDEVKDTHLTNPIPRCSPMTTKSVKVIFRSEIIAYPEPLASGIIGPASPGRMELQWIGLQHLSPGEGVQSRGGWCLSVIREFIHIVSRLELYLLH